MKVRYSVIVPVYNEEKAIGGCLSSLAGQTVAGETEIIVVDDGSADTSASVISNFKLLQRKNSAQSAQFQISNLVLLQQNHLGPGAARNLGARKARGEILIFADADMEFARDFVERLAAPIVAGKAGGTFSKEEYLLNKENALARCWNLNLGRRALKMHAESYPDTQEVFRAIRRDRFLAAGGFDTTIGYTDDWTVSRKLGIKARAAPGAKYYHRNPDSLAEVWRQARWFGKNEFLTGSPLRRLYNLFRYCPLTAPVKGAVGVLQHGEPAYFPFKIVYDSAVFTSVMLSFFHEPKYK